MTKVEEGTTNVYADLEYPDADELLVKARLASKIDDIIKQQQLTQTEAAAILGLPQPKLSQLLRGQFRGISEAKMMNCLIRLGLDVQIVVGPAKRKAPDSGHVEVVFS